VISRLAEIKGELRERYSNAGLVVSPKNNYFLYLTKGKDIYIIDHQEHTGPILFKSFKDWLGEFGGYTQLILITLGFFHKQATDYILESNLGAKVTLLQFGIHSIYDDELHPQIFGDRESIVCKILFDTIRDRMGIDFSDDICKYCSRKAVAQCVICASHLCSDHFIPCPLCRAKLCHPDSGRECYYQHNC